MDKDVQLPYPKPQAVLSCVATLKRPEVRHQLSVYRTLEAAGANPGTAEIQRFLPVAQALQVRIYRLVSGRHP